MADSSLGVTVPQNQERITHSFTLQEDLEKHSKDNERKKDPRAQHKWMIIHDKPSPNILLKEGDILKICDQKYRVRKYEKLWYIAQKYSCTSENLFQQNPWLKKRIIKEETTQLKTHQRTTQKITIHTKKQLSVHLKKGDKLLIRNYYTHTVKEDEKIWQISKNYNYKIRAIIKNNPWLEKEKRITYQ
ncbi:LysM peptidoglycan-binding domain-containing protein [Sulfurimonas sp. SAG-AH-194-I05]|nr:LysM peptidoglycan-binding domain-containing protein [Sulfurimonas sp. SAG-AH-194-I05]MDF1874844.1 LysM peptidoglycan-binding domain-containing protein [Sulfurimonas sp. SAG-AH-194-I05]